MAADMKPPAQDNVMTLAGTYKSFGGLKVIENVGFDVRRGQRLALIGPNGAGKTTIFNLISGVYPVDQGRIMLDGKDITEVPVADRIGYGLARSFQNIRLMPHLTTLENVMLGQHVRVRAIGELFKPLGWAAGRRWRDRAAETLDRFGLETYPGQAVANLPYGVRKRIEVVRALMADPKLLMLDEPAAGLNHRETDELQALLRQVNDAGVTLMVVEHDMHFVRSLCDHVVVLNFGRKIFEGTPDEVHKDRGVLEAYLGTDTKRKAKRKSKPGRKEKTRA
jgi:branched-chain amino acid transport system ATP-binding protein